MGFRIDKEPHEATIGLIDFMFNQFTTVPLIFEDSRNKHCPEGGNITIDKCYADECWFFETTRCNWSKMFLKNLWLLSDYNRDINLSQVPTLELVEGELSEVIQLMADKHAEETAECEYEKRIQEAEAAEGLAPSLPTGPPKSQLDKFLETMSSQTPSDKYILGTELTSHDVYGVQTTTPGGENKEEHLVNISKDESAQILNKTAK
uniref:Uncharacterized protein n=1 Tax=Romanomermis culicivorax TaxID=13658 RepID=A0A915L2S3_ROMCU